MTSYGALPFLMVGLIACEPPPSADDSADPCADESLPDCPAPCPDDWSSTCGEPCTVDGEACGNDIGDGRTCTGGAWQCSVHAPLEPGACNQVCATSTP